MQLVAVYGNSRINGGEVRNSVPFLWKLTLALLAMDVEYEPVESSERGRSFRTVLQTECRGEDVLITVTNSHRAAKPVPPDEWQLPEEALCGLSEKGLRRLLGVD